MAGRWIPIPPPAPRPHVGPPARAATHAPRALQPRAPPARACAQAAALPPFPPPPARALARNRQDSPSLADGVQAH